MGSLIPFPEPPRRAEVEADDTELDAAVFWAPLMVVWVAGVARVALALAHRDAFGAEATLAFAYLLALPLAWAQRWLSAPTSPPTKPFETRANRRRPMA
jgi:hypothetical protein